MNAGFIALSTRHHPDLLRRYWELCRRIPSDRTLVAASEYDQPFWGGDQDAINALLMSEVDADAVVELPQEEGPSPELLHDVRIVDERTLECELRGHTPYLLHYWGGPKPWARNAWMRVSRDAYVRLMPRVLLGPDVPVRLDPAELPLWLRPTPAGRATLAVLSGVNRTARRLLELRAAGCATPHGKRNSALGALIACGSRGSPLLWMSRVLDSARGTLRVWLAAALAAAAAACTFSAPALAADYSDTNFHEDTIVGGLTIPTTAAWAPDGRVFIAEKSGLLKVLNPGESSATTILDISDQVNDAYDRGLLGLAVDTSFETNHYVYLLYTGEAHPLMADTDAPTFSRLVADRGERLQHRLRRRRRCSAARRIA